MSLFLCNHSQSYNKWPRGDHTYGATETSAPSTSAPAAAISAAISAAESNGLPSQLGSMNAHFHAHALKVARFWIEKLPRGKDQVRGTSRHLNTMGVFNLRSQVSIAIYNIMLATCFIDSLISRITGLNVLLSAFSQQLSGGSLSIVSNRSFCDSLVHQGQAIVPGIQSTYRKSFNYSKAKVPNRTFVCYC